jgi:hypothetical protein
MKEQLIEGVQHAASGKVALAVGIGTATAPGWINSVNTVVSGEYFGSVLILLGAIVSITIVAINIQSFWIKSQTFKQKRRQEKIRTALLEKQAEEKHIKID